MLKVFAVIELVLLIVYPGAHGLSRDDFPPGFVFGASTSAYQVHFSLSQFLNVYYYICSCNFFLFTSIILFTVLVF